MEFVCKSSLLFQFLLSKCLLYKYEIKSETHNGTKTQFNLHFIKTGILDIQYGKLYSNLFLWRQETDYADFIDFDEHTVVPLAEKVLEMNKLLIILIKE